MNPSIGVDWEGKKLVFDLAEMVKASADLIAVGPMATYGVSLILW